jgi:cilia- and flagella-associated protein 52
VLWDVDSGEAICGSPTHADFVLCMRFFNTCSNKLVTAGNYNLQVWTYDAENNKLRPEDVRLGNLQRQFRSILIDAQDRFAYAGSTSGDVMQVRYVPGMCLVT